MIQKCLEVSFFHDFKYAFCCEKWSTNLLGSFSVHVFFCFWGSVSSCSTKSLLQKLENIDENGPASWLPVSCAAPETPTESMEFLARSWSVSAVELSKALSNTRVAIDNVEKDSCFCSAEADAQDASSTTSKESVRSLASIQAVYKSCSCLHDSVIYFPKQTEMFELTKMFYLSNCQLVSSKNYTKLVDFSI